MTPRNSVRKTTGPYTVWDTGFAFVVAPTDPRSHPHINMAVHNEQVKRWPTGNATSDQIDSMFRSAWEYCNELNEKGGK